MSNLILKIERGSIMTQVKERISDAELDKKEYAQFQREYADWCKKFDINYIVDQEEETDDE